MLEVIIAGIKIHFSAKANGGFTLIELMIALAISGIVMGSIYSAYLAQQRTYLAQEQVVEMQQNIRAAMDIMVRQIRMAGYDPSGAAAAGFTTAQVRQIGFTQDINGNGDTSDSGEMIDFGFSAAAVPSLGRRTGGSGGYQSIAENIQAIEFLYLDADGTVARTLDDIRFVQVSILARASRPDPSFTNTMTYTPASGTAWDLNGASTEGNAANDHFRRQLLITTIQCRNMGQ